MNMRDLIRLCESTEPRTPAEAFEKDAESALEELSSHVSVILFTTEDRKVELHQINASTMRQGWGTKAMNIIIALADKHRIVLTLEIDNDSDDDWGSFDDDDEDEDAGEDPDRIPTNDDLIGWYGSYGFSLRPSLSSRIQMIRRPKLAIEAVAEGTKGRSTTGGEIGAPIEIVVKLYPHSGEYGELKLSAFRDGSEVAYAFVVATGEVDITGREMVEVTNVFVDEKARRQGVATALYDKLEAMGYLIDPSASQSAAGRAFWKHRRP